MNRWRAFTCIFLGGLGTFLGITFVLMYVWEAVISRMGDPDQSLLFWYLPILFLGIVIGGGGAALLIFGINAIKTIRGSRS